jgi:hypothetical protein
VTRAFTSSARCLPDDRRFHRIRCPARRWDDPYQLALDLMPVSRLGLKIGTETWDVTRYPARPDTNHDFRQDPAAVPQFVGIEFRCAGRVLRVPLSAGSLPSRDEFAQMPPSQFIGLLARAQPVEE